MRRRRFRSARPLQCDNRHGVIANLLSCSTLAFIRKGPGGGGLDHGGGTDRASGRRRFLLDFGRRQGSAFSARRGDAEADGFGEALRQASERDTNDALAAIGRAMFDWLDGSGWASAWADALGDDRILEVKVGARRGTPETALLDAPWELIARADGPFALDALQLFVVARRVGEPGTPFALATPTCNSCSWPSRRRANASSTSRRRRRRSFRPTQRLPLRLVVEETGKQRFLGERLNSDEGPFEALPGRSCRSSSGFRPKRQATCSIRPSSPSARRARNSTASPRPRTGTAPISTCSTGSAGSARRSPSPSADTSAGEFSMDKSALDVISAIATGGAARDPGEDARHAEEARRGRPAAEDLRSPGDAGASAATSRSARRRRRTTAPCRWRSAPSISAPPTTAASSCSGAGAPRR